MQQMMGAPGVVLHGLHPTPLPPKPMPSYLEAGKGTCQHLVKLLQVDAVKQQPRQPHKAHSQLRRHSSDGGGGGQGPGGRQLGVPVCSAVGQGRDEGEGVGGRGA